MSPPGPLASALLLLGSLAAFVFSMLLFVEAGTAASAPIDSATPAGLGRFLVPVLLFSAVLAGAGLVLWAWEGLILKARPGSWTFPR